MNIFRLAVLLASSIVSMAGCASSGGSSVPNYQVFYFDGYISIPSEFVAVPVKTDEWLAFHHVNDCLLYSKEGCRSDVFYLVFRGFGDDLCSRDKVKCDVLSDETINGIQLKKMKVTRDGASEDVFLAKGGNQEEIYFTDTTSELPLGLVKSWKSWRVK